MKIAILDTGASRKHPYLTANGSVNLVGKSHSKKWDDDNGHGTPYCGHYRCRQLHG